MIGYDSGMEKFAICDVCGRPPAETRLFYQFAGLDSDLRELDGSLCFECIKKVVIAIAQAHPDVFQEIIRQAAMESEGPPA